MALLAPVFDSDTVPLNVLPDWVSVMAPLVALKLALPATLNEVLATCVMLPDAVTPRLPVSRLTFPITNALLLFTAMLYAPVLMSDTAPLKAFPRVSVIRPFVALKQALPPTVRMGVRGSGVMFPVVITDSFPAAMLCGTQN